MSQGLNALIAAACIAIVAVAGIYLYDRNANRPKAPSAEEQALIDGLTRGFMAVGAEAAAND